MLPGRGRQLVSALVDVLDEGREQRRGAAQGAERGRVVHARRADERDRAERAARDAVARRDDRERLQHGVAVLDADADGHGGRAEHLAQQLQQLRALLQQRREARQVAGLARAQLAHQPRRAADVHAVVVEHVGEDRRQGRQEVALAGGQVGRLQVAAQRRPCRSRCRSRSR